MKLRDETRTVQYDTMPREAVSLEIERGGMSEELRVLYVAMTRAKEKLIMLTSLEDPLKTLGKLGAQLTDAKAISSYVVRSAASFSDWILSCALRHPSGGELREKAGVLSGIMLTKGEKLENYFGSCDGKTGRKRPKSAGRGNRREINRDLNRLC